MHKIRLTVHNSNSQIEERREKVRKLRARQKTEQQIARDLGVDQGTISRDIKAIKEKSRQFIYDLAKSDIADEYKKALDTIEEVLYEAWSLYDKEDSSPRDKLMALKRIVEAVESKAKLLDGGPTVLSMQAMEDRLSSVEKEDQDNNVVD